MITVNVGSTLPYTELYDAVRDVVVTQNASSLPDDIDFVIQDDITETKGPVVLSNITFNNHKIRVYGNNWQNLRWYERPTLLINHSCYNVLDPLYLKETRGVIENGTNIYGAGSIEYFGFNIKHIAAHHGSGVSIGDLNFNSDKVSMHDICIDGNNFCFTLYAYGVYGPTGSAYNMKIYNIERGVGYFSDNHTLENFSFYNVTLPLDSQGAYWYLRNCYLDSQLFVIGNCDRIQLVNCACTGNYSSYTYAPGTTGNIWDVNRNLEFKSLDPNDHRFLVPKYKPGRRMAISGAVPVSALSDIDGRVKPVYKSYYAIGAHEGIFNPRMRSVE